MFIDARDDIETTSTVQPVGDAQPVSESVDITPLTTEAVVASIPPVSQQVKRKELRAQDAETSVGDETTNPLAQNFKKAKVTGKGVQMVERIAQLQYEDEEDQNRTGFLQVRLIGPKERKRAKKVPKAKDGDKKN